jgi:hypothetical protein
VYGEVVCDRHYSRKHSLVFRSDTAKDGEDCIVVVVGMSTSVHCFL